MKLNSVLVSMGHGKRKSVLAVALCASLAIACPLSASAATVTGSVSNGTTEKVAAGDPVVLIALGQGMQEIGHTKTDSAGRFSIDVPDSGMHLIRVDHQGAAYFQPLPPNTSSVNVQVFDVSAAVAGVGTEANVMRVQTDAQGLGVVQNFFIKNSSSPPRTQFSNHSYEVYLPPGAEIDSSAAMGPGSMPVQSSPIPLAEKGLYAFLFPLRPGETQFQLSYHLPYSGSFSFAPRLPTAVANFVVILPKSMTFKAGPGVSFEPLQEDVNAQTFLVRNVAAAQPLSFAVSGSGVMPRDSAATGSQAGADQETAQGASALDSSSASPSSTDTRPGIGLANPIDTPDPLNKYKWWILGGLAVIFAIAAGFFLHRPVNEPTAAPLAPGQSVASAPIAAASTAFSGNVLLAALKEELFTLESDRVQGRLSDADYGDLKSALELVLRRALSR